MRKNRFITGIVGPIATLGLVALSLRLFKTIISQESTENDTFRGAERVFLIISIITVLLSALLSLDDYLTTPNRQPNADLYNNEPNPPPPLQRRSKVRFQAGR